MPDSNMVNWQEKQLVKKKVTLVRSGVPAVRFGTRRLIWWAFVDQAGSEKRCRIRSSRVGSPLSWYP